MQSEQKTELLGQARVCMEKLMLRWAVGPELWQAPDKNPDVRWMLDHPYAAYLALDEELAQKPSGARRSAALYLAGRLGRQSLGQYLPELLVNCDTDEERLEVLDCMAALRDATSLKTLEAFASQASQEVNEALLVAAVRGLGLSAQAGYLPSVNAARRWFKSPAAQLEGAKAAWRCGDQNALAEVGQFLYSPDAEVQADVIAFLRENFCAEALAMLAALARTAQDQEVAAKAVQAIVEGSKYGEPLPQEREKLGDLPDLDALVDPRAGPAGQPKEPPADATPGGVPADITKLSAEELQGLLQRLEAWWSAEGAELLEKRRQMDSVS